MNFPQSDNQDIEKLHDIDANHENGNGGGHLTSSGRDYISSPGYDTSSSTAPASSPDPCEYTYEGAIQDYKSRVSRASITTGIASSAGTGIAASVAYSTSSNFYANSSKDSTPERTTTATAPAPPKRPLSTAIESRLLNFETKETEITTDVSSTTTHRKELPKVDIGKRRELFEREQPPTPAAETNGGSSAVVAATASDKAIARLSSDFSNAISIRERLSNLEKRDEIKDAAIKKLNRLSGEEFGSVKDRLVNIERDPFVAVAVTEKPLIDVPIVALKDRLSSLHGHGHVKLAHDDDYTRNDGGGGGGVVVLEPSEPPLKIEPVFIDDVLPTASERGSGGEEDSGIHTADVSCAVSQNDEEVDEEIIVVPDVVPKPSSTVSAPQPIVAVVEAVEELIEDVSVLEQESSVSSESDSITFRERQGGNGCTGINDNKVEHLENIANPSNSIAEKNERTVELVNNPTLISESTHTISSRKNVLTTNNNAVTTITNETTVVNSISKFADITSHKAEVVVTTTSTASTATSSSEFSRFNDVVRTSLSRVDSLTPFFKATVDFLKKPSTLLSELSQSASDAVTDLSSRCDVITTSSAADIKQPPPFESIDAKNQRLKCQIVGVLEKNKQSIDVVDHAAAESAPSSVTPTAPLSPASSTRSSSSSKSSTKNIFDFIKLNLLNETNENLLEKSTFYVALTEHEQTAAAAAATSAAATNRCTDAILAKGDSFESSASELNRMLDEELNKLN